MRKITAVALCLFLSGCGLGKKEKPAQISKSMEAMGDSSAPQKAQPTVQNPAPAGTSGTSRPPVPDLPDAVPPSSTKNEIPTLPDPVPPVLDKDVIPELPDPFRPNLSKNRKPRPVQPPEQVPEDPLASSDPEKRRRADKAGRVSIVPPQHWVLYDDTLDEDGYSYLTFDEPVQDAYSCFCGVLSAPLKEIGDTEKAAKKMATDGNRKILSSKECKVAGSITGKMYQSEKIQNEAHLIRNMVSFQDQENAYILFIDYRVGKKERAEKVWDTLLSTLKLVEK